MGVFKYERCGDCDYRAVLKKKPRPCPKCGKLMEASENYYIRYQVAGKVHVKAVSPSLRFAQDALGKVKVDVREGRFFEKQRDVSWAEMKKDFLSWALTNVKPKSHKMYVNSLNALEPHFGGMLLSKITPQLVEEYKKARLVKIVDGKPVNLSPATVNRDLATIKRMFSLAEEWGRIETNKMRRVKKLKEADPRARFLTAEEENRLLLECRVSSEELYLMVLIALNTGLRKEAIVSLKWTQIDFKARMLVQTGKGDKTVRIPLTGALSEALIAYRSRQPVMYPHVFPGDVDPMRPRNATVHAPWDRAVERAGLEDFRFHDLRHTFATNFFRATKNWRALQEILGHSDVSVTMRIYCHLDDTDKRNAMNEFEEGKNGKARQNG